MSYCRWSSDDWQCDVYVYEDIGGWWQTYLAGRKRRLRDGVEFPAPLPDEWEPQAWLARNRAVDAILDDANEGVLWDWVDLPDHPDGDSFRDDTPGECADRLEALRAFGYNVPQCAIDELREEAAALAASDPKAEETK